MSLLRIVTRAAKRPSIHEIAASILSPTRTCRAYHANPIPHPRPLPSVSSSPSAFSRSLSTSPYLSQASAPPKSHDRGPASSETTQTDFNSLDVLGATPVPSTSIDACLWDGFHLNNGVKITDGMGVLLVGGEAFAWMPWGAGGKEGELKLLNKKGQWEVGDDAWGVLGLVWPKPGMFIVPKSLPTYSNGLLRSTHPRRWPLYGASEPINEKIHQQPGY